MTGVFYVPLWQHGGGTDTEEESAHKVDSGEVNSPAAPAGIRTTQTFDHESGALTNKLCRLESLLHQQTASIHFRGSEVAGYFYITRCIGLFLLTNHFRQCIRCQPLCKEVNGIIGVSVRLSQSLVNRCPCLTPHVLLRGAFNCAVLFWTRRWWSTVPSHFELDDGDQLCCLILNSTVVINCAGSFWTRRWWSTVLSYFEFDCGDQLCCLIFNTTVVINCAVSFLIPLWRSTVLSYFEHHCGDQLCCLISNTTVEINCVV